MSGEFDWVAGHALFFGLVTVAVIAYHRLTGEGERD